MFTPCVSTRNATKLGQHEAVPTELPDLQTCSFPILPIPMPQDAYMEAYADEAVTVIYALRLPQL